MIVSTEQHVYWVGEYLPYMRAQRLDVVEPTPIAEAGWVRHVNDCGDITLFPTANSWYMGANVPGKPRVFLPYVGGVDVYRKACDSAVEQDFLGFALSRQGGTTRNDGVNNRQQPHAQLVLDQ